MPLCIETGCISSQNYQTGGKKGFCSKHGGKPLCIETGCISSQNYRKGGKKGFCCRHRGYPQCTKCNYMSVKKEGTLCSYCDPIKLEKMKKRHKSKENNIASFLTKKDIKYEREVYLDFSCFETINDETKSCRVDFVIYTESRIIILELDENQHKSYKISCENRRLAQIIGNQIEREEKLLIIRYNPDEFYVYNEKIKYNQQDKMDFLLHFIESYTIVNEKIDIVYLFYDISNQDNYPVIVCDTEYNETLKQLTIPIDIVKQFSDFVTNKICTK